MVAVVHNFSNIHCSKLMQYFNCG